MFNKHIEKLMNLTIEVKKNNFDIEFIEAIKEEIVLINNLLIKGLD